MRKRRRREGGGERAEAQGAAKGPAGSDRPKDLIPAKEAAEALEVGASTVYRWVKTGRLRYWVWPVKRYFVSRAEALAMIREGKPEVPLPDPLTTPRTREQMEEAAERAKAELRADGWKV